MVALGDFLVIMSVHQHAIKLGASYSISLKRSVLHRTLYYTTLRIAFYLTLCYSLDIDNQEGFFSERLIKKSFSIS